MVKNSAWGDRSCTDVLRLMGAGLGVLLFLYLWLAAAPGFLMSAFWGVVLFVAIGWIAAPLLCREDDIVDTGGTGTTPRSGTRPADAPAPTPPRPEAPAAQPPAAPQAQPDEAQPTAPAQTAEPAAGAEPAAPQGARKPAGLDGPRGGKADDLKLIKGIGPALEKMLNEMGIFHYDQIAAWTPEEVAWMDANMPRFKGRASRDDWVGQARRLAAGEETDFAARAKSDNRYG